jgi:hypothetical protein
MWEGGMLRVKSLICLATTLVFIAQMEAGAGLLDRRVPKMSFSGKSLPEVAKLLSDATKVKITLARQIQNCIAKRTGDVTERGPCCDWNIGGDWHGGQTLESALWAITESANLTYRVVGRDAIEITFKNAPAR